MSMAMALEGIRDYLRSANDWDQKSCGIQEDGLPPEYAGKYFVSIDDDGVLGGPEDVYDLEETLLIEISVWRRPGEIPENRRGQMSLKTDLYLATAMTIDQLERLVIRQVHQNNALRESINTKFGLGVEATGQKFTSPLCYTGRSPNEKAILPESSSHVFVGRRLRFRGLLRVQDIEYMR